MNIRYFRFDDLKAAGIVRNRPTLYRWIKERGFPGGILLGPNTRAWPEADILRWLESKSTDGETPEPQGSRGAVRRSASLFQK